MSTEREKSNCALGMFLFGFYREFDFALFLGELGWVCHSNMTIFRSRFWFCFSSQETELLRKEAEETAARLRKEAEEVAERRRQQELEEEERRRRDEACAAGVTAGLRFCYEHGAGGLAHTPDAYGIENTF